MSAQPRTWLEEDVAGIDVGDNLISLAQVRFRGDAIMLTRAGWCPRPAGASERQLAAAVSRLCRDCRATTSTISSSIQSRTLILRHFESDRDEDRSAVQSRLITEARDILQVPPNQIGLDWRWTSSTGAVPNRAAERGRKRDGLFIALPRAELDAHMHFVQKCGLFPVAVEAGCTAVANLYRTLRPRVDECVCLALLRCHSADICILKPRGLLYPRHLDLSAESADGRLSEIVPHIHEAIRYSRFKLGVGSIGRVVFTGEGLDDVDSRKDLGLGDLQVEFWNPLDDLPEPTRVSTRAEFDPARGHRLAVALGLALRGGDDE